MLVGERGDLRQVGDAEDLVACGHRLELPAHDLGHSPADARRRPRRTRASRRALRGSRPTSAPASRATARRRRRCGPAAAAPRRGWARSGTRRVSRPSAVHLAGSPSAVAADSGSKRTLKTRPLHRQLRETPPAPSSRATARPSRRPSETRRAAVRNSLARAAAPLLERALLFLGASQERQLARGNGRQRRSPRRPRRRTSSSGAR